MKFPTHTHRCIALALAGNAVGVAVAADAPVAHPAPSYVVIESETAPAKRTPEPPVPQEVVDAAIADLRRQVTRMDLPNGSTVYRYNGVLQEKAVVTRGADGKFQMVCGHTGHGGHASETVNDR